MIFAVFQLLGEKVTLRNVHHIGTDSVSAHTNDCMRDYVDRPKPFLPVTSLENVPQEFGDPRYVTSIGMIHTSPSLSAILHDNPPDPTHVRPLHLGQPVQYHHTCIFRQTFERR